MRKLLVIGVGNRIMEDDSIGVRVVETLAERNYSTDIDFLAGETDVDYCLTQLTGADKCIIVDGSLSGEKPCTVKAYPLEKIVGQSRAVHSFHDLDLIHAMKREQIEKKGLLITIEVAELGFSAELSRTMRENFDEIISRVGKIIQEYRKQ